MFLQDGVFGMHWYVSVVLEYLAADILQYKF